MPSYQSTTKDFSEEEKKGGALKVPFGHNRKGQEATARAAMLFVSL